ncbi:MAG: hypothetical protein JNL69_02055 [Bacteroidia bacterium]|nr:hypothetical protein [Bacteroidia bacterium]
MLLISANSKAQFQDSITSTKSDTLIQKKNNPAINHSPKKAALFSTALPGLGQAYNKKYWKIPVIYVGFAGLAYAINSNQIKYDRYKTAYKYRLDGDPSTTDIYVGVYTDDNLNTLQKYYRRYRDLSIIGAAALYVLNIVDATVDAHLFTFDVSDDLTFNIHPTIINTTQQNNYTTGIGLKIKF